MIIYNVTVKIDHDAHNDWLWWMRSTHIPDVINTKCFTEYRLSKVLPGEEDGITYSIQYSCPDMETLEKYQQEFAPRLQQEHTERYQGKFVAFRTLLEVVD